MNPFHVIVIILLCAFILLRVKIPPKLHKFVGTGPGIIILLGIIFYLFTESPLVGVLSLIAAYEMVYTPLPIYNNVDDHLPDQLEFTPTKQFKPTLEENVVNTMVPLVQTPTPNHLNFKYLLANNHNAASLV
jgi:hypothetical protein